MLTTARHTGLGLGGTINDFRWLNVDKADKLLAQDSHAELREYLQYVSTKPQADSERAVATLLLAQSLAARHEWDTVETLLSQQGGWPAQLPGSYTARLARVRQSLGDHREAEPSETHTARLGSVEAFTSELVVKCPSCGAPGAVSCPRGKASFACLRCGTTVATWQGPVQLTYRCGLCGDRWQTDADRLPNGLRQDQRTSCPQGHIAPAHVTWSEADVYHRTPPRDPALGLELALAEETRLGWVWAFNLEHLGELRAFVAARMRITRPDSNRQWANRLPAWMTAAKHRDEVLRAIDRIVR